MLRQHQLDALDRANIASEIEKLFAEDADLARERIRVLLTALLRWAYQGDLRSSALASTITAQRGGIEHTLADSASLRSLVDDWVIEMYPEAKRMAAIESGLFEDSFPAGLPFLPSEVFDLYFFPDPFKEDEGKADAWWRKPQQMKTEKA